MKKQILIIGFMLLTFFVVLSGCFEPQTTEYFKEDYEANENTVLKVTNLNGQIEVNTWDGDTISLNAIKKSTFGQEELDNVEINVIESENQIDIEVRYVGERTSTPSVDMNIKVPTFVYVDTVMTSNGGVQISGIKGDVFATSSNGAVIIKNVDGYVTATTSNGRIDVSGTTGIKGLQSSNLGIKAEVFDFQDNISISTSNGGITVYINPLLNAIVDMSTSNGQISISGISLNVTTDEEKHKVGDLGEGGNTITITTSNGNINLYKLNI
jgi:hypothetical protein